MGLCLSLPLGERFLPSPSHLGVVSGITMSFQFGTNWPGFMEQAGNIAGPLLGYEVLTAFFLEASFLGIMLFGPSPRFQPCSLTRNLYGCVRHLAVGRFGY